MRKVCLPLDVVLIILEYYSDQSMLYELSLTCRTMSPHALRQLWYMPYVSNITSLFYLSTTLQLSNPQYAYKDWIVGLALHMRKEKDGYSYQIIHKDIFEGLSQLRLEILSLQQIHVLKENATFFELFLKSQLNQGLSELHLYDCTPVTFTSISKAIQQEPRIHLRSLAIHHCSLTDHQVEKLVQFCPTLHTLRLEKCGCLSDTATIAIAQNCPLLHTLVVTLPPNIVQSNMITLQTLQALNSNCLSLNKFICTGQTRIAEFSHLFTWTVTTTVLETDPVINADLSPLRTNRAFFLKK
ncbi:uncharacterized protein EV154DRAFT_489481 [Mucor mucedo]|uniref:uncharacterized protein n=1 Tax=Mucor mucedo TaxID=29922 RepID=UPI00221F9FFB|nr:uncharacterized protein EV154DRAFT_489481 [Mucor mucedo]KAI7897259.1 hypothetical protein EV154DRAFT_489481 [Mucor mucedo]